MIEAADIRTGDQVLLLADRRSDPVSIEALTAGLKMHGAIPMSLITEPISRYGMFPTRCYKPCMLRTLLYGFGQFLLPLPQIIERWAASAKKAGPSSRSDG